MKVRFLKLALVILWGSLLWIPWLGAVHLFDWDEINFAEISREMLLTGNYIQSTINFRPFWEKPPLFFWLQTLSYTIWGVNEFAARFPNVLCGLITLVWLTEVGNKNQSNKTGLLWALFYMGSVLPHFYFRSGLLDPWYNLFGFWMFWYGLQSLTQGKVLNYIYVGASGALSLLIKGPAIPGIVLISLLMFALFFHKNLKFSWSGFIVGLLTFVLLGSSWYVLYFFTYGPEMMMEFFRYQMRLFSTADAGHSGFPGFHLIVLLAGVFPASFFFIGLIKKINHITYAPHFILTFLVIVVFSTVKTKIVHYSSMAYFPITYLAASYANHFQWSQFPKRLTMSLGLFSFVIFLIVSSACIFFINPQLFIPIIQEMFVRENIEWSQPTFNTIMFCTWLFSGVMVYFLFKAKRKSQLYIVLLGMTIHIALLIYSFVKPIEKISQGSLILLCQKASEYNLPINTYNFKSYAHWFYGNVHPPGWNMDNNLECASGPYFLLLKTGRYDSLPCPEWERAGGYILSKCGTKE